MEPFLASSPSVHVRKADGSSVDNTTDEDGTQSIIVHQNKNGGSEDMVFAAIPIVAIVFTFLYLIIRAIMAPFTNRAKRAAQAPVMAGGFSDEEAAVLEKLQRTLAQMENRVESLETILIDQARTQQKYGSKL